MRHGDWKCAPLNSDRKFLRIALAIATVSAVVYLVRSWKYASQDIHSAEAYSRAIETAVNLVQSMATEPISDSAESLTLVLRDCRVLSHIPDSGTGNVQKINAEPVTAASSGVSSNEKQKLEALYRVVADAVTARFGPSASPESYATWRVSRGYVPRTLESLMQFNVLPDLYKYELGKELPNNPELFQVFRDLWLHEPKASSEINKPKLIVHDPRAMAVAFRLTSKSDHVLPEVRDADLPMEYWHGGSLLGGTQWWEPPVTSQSVWNTGNKVLTATVAVVCEYADGLRRPLQVWCVWNPAQNTWMLQGIGVTFFSGSAPGGAVY